MTDSLRDSPVQRITVELIYNRLSILFFSSLSLLVAFFANSTLPIKINQVVIPILVLLWLMGYFYLFAEFILFYLSKISSWVKITYTKHYLIYWTLAGLFFLILAIIATATLLGWQKCVEIVSGVVLMAGITFIGYILKKVGEKYLKTKFN